MSQFIALVNIRDNCFVFEALWTSTIFVLLSKIEYTSAIRWTGICDSKRTDGRLQCFKYKTVIFILMKFFQINSEHKIHLFNYCPRWPVLIVLQILPPGQLLFIQRYYLKVLSYMFIMNENKPIRWWKNNLIAINTLQNRQLVGQPIKLLCKLSRCIYYHDIFTQWGCEWPDRYITNITLESGQCIIIALG